MVGNQEHVRPQVAGLALTEHFRAFSKKGKRNLLKWSSKEAASDDSRTMNEIGVTLHRRGGSGHNQRVKWGRIPWLDSIPVFFLGTFRIWLG